MTFVLRIQSICNPMVRFSKYVAILIFLVGIIVLNYNQICRKNFSIIKRKSLVILNCHWHFHQNCVFLYCDGSSEASLWESMIIHFWKDFVSITKLFSKLEIFISDFILDQLLNIMIIMFNMFPFDNQT